MLGNGSMEYGKLLLSAFVAIISSYWDFR